MPSLIGSAPNQVPTNGMLGTMAFQDADNTLVQNLTSTGVVTLKDVSISGTGTAVTPAAGDNSTKIATTEFVGTASPAGQVAFFASSSAPTGWLKANGALVSRTTYSNLFSRIGTTFGSGDGSTTFNLPDLRGEFVRGWDDSRGVDSGRGFGTAQADEFKAHYHDIRTNSITGSGTGGGGYFISNLGVGVMEQTRSTPGGGTETRPRNIALLACIKY